VNRLAIDPTQESRSAYLFALFAVLLTAASSRRAGTLAAVLTNP
jgi:hypothetical protein